MRTVQLASETDFDGWRKAARDLRLADVPPEEVRWTVTPDLFSSPLGEGDRPQGGGGDQPHAMAKGQLSFATAVAEAEPPRPPSTASRSPSPKGEEKPFTVPRAFVDVAQSVILHRSPDRFALLYRLLWRLKDEPRLLEIITDPDVAEAREMAKNVAKAVHKMHAFVRFRLVEGVEPETYVAWFVPAHYVTEKAVPHFVRRFANMRFSILTPDVCAHWDGVQLSFTPGADPEQAPKEDEQEEFWRTYYASIFNPARLKVNAMTKEMPKRYWRNLPEAQLIPSLIEQANTRMEAMVEAAPSAPRKKTAAGEAARVIQQDHATIAPGETPTPRSTADVAEMIQACRRCDLWRDATQGVPGVGPPDAPMMLVGEQPGDSEDLRGLPFVGPAGEMLDRALAEAGVDRSETYVTNSVKHFKHELRGKRRLHKTPDASEISACRWWLNNERQLVRPRVVVALGATAVLAVFGKTLPIGKSRGQAFQLEDQSQGFVTWHPSFLLRVPDAAAKKKAYDELVADLALAHERVKAA